MMSKKYSGDSRSSPSIKSSSSINSGISRDVNSAIGKVNSSRRMHMDLESETNVKSTKVKSNDAYMNKLDREMSKLISSGNGNDDHLDSDDVTEENDGGRNSDGSVSDDGNRSGMRIYKNRKHYIEHEDLEKSGVSDTPILKTLKTKSLVGSNAGTVTFHNNDAIVDKSHSTQKLKKSNASVDNLKCNNYCEVLNRRYQWLGYLMQHGLSLSSLNDELLWAFENHCLCDGIDVNKYSKVMFKKFGSAMFDVNNWFLEE